MTLKLPVLSEPKGTFARWAAELRTFANQINETLNSLGVSVVSSIPTGWTEVESIWKYSSSTVVSTPSGADKLYSRGDRIRLKQGGSYKYFAIIGVTTNSLTLFGGSDYSVTNAAITNIAVSKASSPVGYPSYFNWIPGSQTGWATLPAGGIYHANVIGGFVELFINQPSTATSNDAQTRLQAPLTAMNVTGMYWTSPYTAVDNGTALGWAQCFIAQNSNTIQFGKTSLTLDDFTNTGPKRIASCYLKYPYK